MSKKSRDVSSSKNDKIDMSRSQIVKVNGHEAIVTTDMRSAIAYIRGVVLKHPGEGKTEDTSPESPSDKDKV